MTNRKRLLNTNLYDLLVAINERIIENSSDCILQYLDKNITAAKCAESSCNSCIAAWLNKEEGDRHDLL